MQWSNLRIDKNIKIDVRQMNVKVWTWILCETKLSFFS